MAWEEKVNLTGPPGEQGPAGPNAVSADSGNRAILGSDSLIFVSAPAWGDVTGKPSSFTPSGHSHTAAQVTDFNTAADARVSAGLATFRSSDMGDLQLVKLTQSTYDGLGSKDANTVYFIVG